MFINEFQQISSIYPYRPNIRSAAKSRPVFFVLMLNNSALDTWDPQPGMILLEVLDLNYPSSHVSSSFPILLYIVLCLYLRASVLLYHFNDNVSFFALFSLSFDYTPLA